jgi:hypothetical protein
MRRLLSLNAGAAWSIVLAGMALGACSLPSLDLPVIGLSSGAEKLGGGIVRVGLPRSGPACASADQCTLVTAAATAQRLGGTHFIVLRTGSDQGGQAAYIKVLAIEPADTPPTGAVSVEEALTFFGTRSEPAAP